MSAELCQDNGNCVQMENDELLRRGAIIETDFGLGYDTLYVDDMRRVFNCPYGTRHYLDGSHIHTSNGRSRMFIDGRKCKSVFFIQPGSKSRAIAR